MIYFALCAAIACLAAHHLRRMQLRVAGAGIVWSASVTGGLLAGSILAIGLMTATGMQPQQSALPAMFAQGFWWSLLGTAIGFFTSRLPTKAISIAVACGCAALLLLGSMRTSSDESDHTSQASSQHPAPAVAPVATKTSSDDFDPSRAVPLSTYNEMKKAGDDFNPARAVPLKN